MEVLSWKKYANAHPLYDEFDCLTKENIVVARDGSVALVFDYNMLGKGYVYSDIRNVCGHLGNEEAKETFLTAYGCYDKREEAVDDVVNLLNGLHIACQRKTLSDWGNELLDMVKDGTLLAAVEKLLEEAV